MKKRRRREEEMKNKRRIDEEESVKSMFRRSSKPMVNIVGKVMTRR